ncbi:class I SAM-dependent methyltransferase [Yoonia sp. 208BN28-4]|uniref:class I SAM-dependent methyltransferase n=1 Tax=Yoonia sp. 208BN28-4 TaxID=3126505 RepID=UPI00309F6456
MTQDIYDPQYVAALFDRCSKRYRTWSAVSSFGFIWLWRRQCVSRVMGQRGAARIADGQVTPPGPGATQVVDLMAGTGEIWPHLLAWDSHLRITAIDISRRMHDEAVKRLHGQTAGKIRHIAANALETDLPAGIADMVVSSFGLKTFSPQQQETLAAQIARLLQPGGSFALIEASDPKGWLLRPLYRAYLDRILPLIERIFLKGAQDFSMIGTYTRNFGDCSHMAEALRAQGLRVTYKKHFFGCATSVAGHKPIALPEPSA